VVPLLEEKKNIYMRGCTTRIVMRVNTWYSKARYKDGMNTSSSMYSPVSGMYNPASFLAPILISSPLKVENV